MTAAPFKSAQVRRLALLDETSGRSVGKVSLEAANDHRWARRKSANTAGLIMSERLSHAVRCLVRDSSSSGALLDLVVEASASSVADDLPDRFVLVIQRYRERSEVQCVVARRMGSQVGVKFTSHFRTTAVAARPQPARRTGTRG